MNNYSKTTTIFQMDATECGAACLDMVMAYHGIYVPFDLIKVEISAYKDEINAAQIMRAAKRMGLECHGYRKEPEGLRELEMPCIIHWNFNHFVVLEGFKEKNVYLNDPAVGRRELTWEEFDNGFTGVVLTFNKKGL